MSDRAALAAARVAARYAKAPSYSEMQAAEARAALRAAEVATRAALEAQVAAQAALDSFDAAQVEEEEYAEPEIQSQAYVAALPAPAPQASQAVEHRTQAEEPQRTAPLASGPLQVRWDPDMPVRSEAEAVRPQMQPAEAVDWWNAPGVGVGAVSGQTVEMVEAAQPIPANLIEFPRELVATRRMRPRLAEAAHAHSADRCEQLSIFEVDPEAVSIEPTAPVAEAAPVASWTASGIATGTGAEWSGIELDAHAEPESERRDELHSDRAELDLAPLGMRLMATVVDLALIVGLVCAAAAGLAGRVQPGSDLRTAEGMGMAAMLLVGVLYHTFFLLVARATPGMMYAGIGLCTFDDEHPSRAQLRNRLVAMLASVLPVGLGLAWAAFDEDHLSWHDRLSRTYLRKH